MKDPKDSNKRGELRKSYWSAAAVLINLAYNVAKLDATELDSVERDALDLQHKINELLKEIQATKGTK